MSVEKESVAEDIFVECPYCKVCSITLAQEEHTKIKDEK